MESHLLLLPNKAETRVVTCFQNKSIDFKIHLEMTQTDNIIKGLKYSSLELNSAESPQGKVTQHS